MTKIVLYQIPSSEIEFLFHGLNHPYYWNPAHSHLMRWDLRLTTTDMAIASDLLSEIADLTGDIILDGLLDDGIGSKLCHQIVNYQFLYYMFPFIFFILFKLEYYNLNISFLLTMFFFIILVHINYFDKIMNTIN